MSARDPKAWAALQGRAALAGLRLHGFEDNRGHENFLIEWWWLSQTVYSVQAVDALVDRLWLRPFEFEVFN